MDNQVTTSPADDKRIIIDNRSTNKIGTYCNFQHILRAGQRLGKTIYKKLMTKLFFKKILFSKLCAGKESEIQKDNNFRSRPISRMVKEMTNVIFWNTHDAKSYFLGKRNAKNLLRIPECT